MKIKAIILSIGILTTMFTTACEKEKKSDSTTATKGNLILHMHSNAGDNEIEYDSTYIINGRSVKFTLAQLYISEIQLVKLDGSTYDVTGKKLLKTTEEEELEVGDVTVGNYKSIRFKVGFNSTANALASNDLADSAILNHPEMWFSGSAQPDGYVFLNLQGGIDTTTNLSGVLTPFTYKIGTVANAVNISLPDKGFSIAEKQTQFVHISIDYYKLFQNIQLNNGVNLNVATTADNSNSTATKIVSNISSIFGYE